MKFNHNLRKTIKKNRIIYWVYYSLFFPNRKFSNSENYWENRYKKGGTSGAGSYGNLALFKAEILNLFIKEKNISNVIELGCGDGNNLSLMNYQEYVGLDVSETAIKICSKKFENDDSKEFYLYSEFVSKNKFELSISLDVIYHLVEDEIFHEYIKNLINLSTKYIVIYSSNFNSNQQNHVRHRNFTEYIDTNFKEVNLIDKIKNKFPWDSKLPDKTSLADFYIYEKI